jgi:ubiquinone/menaquinone biosynthesis C-methylase UbiE
MRDPRLSYLDELLSAVPVGTRRALDVGCGEGELARRLADRVERVVAIDRSAEMIEQARALTPQHRNLTLVVGDFLEHGFADDAFDLVVAVASLHHLDLGPALAEMSRILRPGGTLLVHGLARDSSVLDYTRSALALALGLFVRARRGEWRSPLAIGPSKMPLRDPTTTYREVARRSARLLAGRRFTRHLFFRYTIAWHKPEAPGAGPG